MSILSHLKGIVEKLPANVGMSLTWIPYGVRLGPTYTQASNAIRNSEICDQELLLQVILSKLEKQILEAGNSCAFYQSFYDQQGYSPSTVESLNDWQEVPIVTKMDLQSFSITERCVPGRTGMKINTGGTSGQPLEFFLDNQAFAREWAHMHFVWKARGYRTHHLKLTFRGKHFDSKQAIRYNAVHNEYVVNANAPMTNVVDAVLSLPKRTIVRWLHGYPSLVAEFAHAVSRRKVVEIELIRGRLFGVLLGSEYPAPVYRDVIESVLSTNVVSWYGHSEMAVLAREIASGVYQSLPSYGFAEAVPTNDGTAHRLVCTSLHNKVHPFIRYDTGDLIEPITQAGGVLTFRIAEGRVGDFIEDLNGQRHSLTAIIFGRHHQSFNQLQHVQVRQDAPGLVTVVVTPRDMILDVESIQRGFDLDDLPIQWRFEKVQSPVRTAAGKICLKIS